MELYNIGMDVHSKNTVFVAGRSAGEHLVRGKVETTPEGMKKMVRKLKNKIPQGERYRVVVGMESGSSTYRVARILRHIGVEVRVFHAREVRDLVAKKKQKTDKRDAEVIYREMFGEHFVQFSYIPGTDHEAMVRTLISRREGYVSDRSRAIVKTKALLRQWGLLRDSGRTLTSETGWEKLLEDLRGMDEESWQAVAGWDVGLDILEDIIGMTEKSFESWKAAKANIDDCEARIKDIIREMDEKGEDLGDGNERQKKRQKYMEELKKEISMEKEGPPKEEEKKLNIAERIDMVDKMTGIGWLSAMKIVFLIGDPGRFRKSGAVKSYFGLIPSEYSSGGMSRKGHLTKSGNQIGRTTLIQIAKQASRVNHPLHPMYARLKHKRRANIAAIAVASRLVRIIWSMLRYGTEFDPMRLHIFLVNKPVKGKESENGKIKTKLVAVEEKDLLTFMRTNELGPEALESPEARKYYEAMVKTNKYKEVRH